MMYKEKRVKIPIFFGELRIILTEDLEGVNTKYKLEPLSMKGFQAVTFIYEPRGYTYFCMAFKPDADLKTIVHESVHAVNYILKTRGVLLCPHNDETQAYLTGWVFDQAYKFLIKELNGQRSVL